jgi:hypothetical protein
VSTELERIAALEVHVSTINKALEEHTEKSEKHYIDTARKLDDLIGLKHRGLGAFWAASALLGTGIVTFMSQLWEWLKHP